MINLTISDAAVVAVAVMFSVFGVAFIGSAAWDGVVWLATRKNRKKYRLTYVHHSDELVVKINDRESSQ